MSPCISTQLAINKWLASTLSHSLATWKLESLTYQPSCRALGSKTFPDRIWAPTSAPALQKTVPGHVCCFFGGHHFFSNRWSDNKKWYVSYLSIDLGEAPKCRRKNALSEVCYMRTRTDACLASEFLRDLISALPSHVTSLQVGCCEVRTWSWPFISLKAPNPTTSTRLSPPHKPQSYIVQ